MLATQLQALGMQLHHNTHCTPAPTANNAKQAHCRRHYIQYSTGTPTGVCYMVQNGDEWPYSAAALPALLPPSASRVLATPSRAAACCHDLRPLPPAAPAPAPAVPATFFSSKNLLLTDLVCLLLGDMSSSSKRLRACRRPVIMCVHQAMHCMHPVMQIMHCCWSSTNAWF